MQALILIGVVVVLAVVVYLAVEFRGSFRSVYLGNLMAEEFARAGKSTVSEARNLLMHMDVTRVLLKAQILREEEAIGRRLNEEEIRERMFSFFKDSIEAWREKCEAE